MFILVECAERELNADQYTTLREAQKAMKEYYDEAGPAEDEGWYETEAYKTDANNHSNYDWKIFEFPPVGL